MDMMVAMLMVMEEEKGGSVADEDDTAAMIGRESADGSWVLLYCSHKYSRNLLSSDMKKTLQFAQK